MNDPRLKKVSLSDISPQLPDTHYDDESHHVWKMLFDTQSGYLRGKIDPRFFDGLEVFAISGSVPSLQEVNDRLFQITGWKLVHVNGLLEPREYFSLLAQKAFATTSYIRPLNELEYTPAPDIFHDIFGHIPFLVIPEIANLARMLGVLYGRCTTDTQRHSVEKLYWFSIEFGLLRSKSGNFQILGAGIASGNGESRRIFDTPQTLTFQRLTAEKVHELEYDFFRQQPRFLVADDVFHILQVFEEILHF